MSDVGSVLTDRAYAAGWRLVRTLPERPCRRMFDWGADRISHRPAVDQLRRNLARVLGVAPVEVPAQLMRDSMRSYARYWREVFRLPAMDHRALADSELMPPPPDLVGLDAALAAGRGVVFALPHSGNWDMAGVWLVQHYGRFATVTERLRPQSLFERFVAYRESLGFEVFAYPGGQQVFTQLAQRLRRNMVVCLLGERDLTGRGVPVTFFGEQTWMPAGPARLAIDTGAALLPAYAWFTVDEQGREGWGLQTGPEVDVSGGVVPATQTLADYFAREIAAHPADWHMLQPLWAADLSLARRARMAAVRDALPIRDEPQ